MELVPKCIFLLISLVPTGIRWCSKNCILIITWKPTLIYTCIKVGLKMLSFMCVMTRSAKITLFLCIFTCNNAVNCIQYCSMYWQNPQTSFFAIICRRPKTRFYFFGVETFLISPAKSRFNLSWTDKCDKFSLCEWVDVKSKFPYLY